MWGINSCVQYTQKRTDFVIKARSKSKVKQFEPSTTQLGMGVLECDEGRSKEARLQTGCLEGRPVSGLSLALLSPDIDKLSKDRADSNNLVICNFPVL